MDHQVDVIFKELLDGTFALSLWIGRHRVLIRCNDERSADKLARTISDCVHSFQIGRKRKGWNVT